MEADELYGLALDRFVPERGALAKALRAEGRREDAARVAALRRPSVAAWAVNQLVRTQRAAVQELFDAGDELRDAQANLLAGTGDGRALRAAGERERAAVDALIEAARGLLTSQGEDLSATMIERVSDTLHAAALGEAAREQVREGRLERELRHVGLGIGDEAVAAFAPAPPSAGKAAKAGTSKARDVEGGRGRDVEGGRAGTAGRGSKAGAKDKPAAGGHPARAGTRRGGGRRACRERPRAAQARGGGARGGRAR